MSESTIKLYQEAYKTSHSRGNESFLCPVCQRVVVHDAAETMSSYHKGCPRMGFDVLQVLLERGLVTDEWANRHTADHGRYEFLRKLEFVVGDVKDYFCDVCDRDDGDCVRGPIPWEDLG